MQKFYKSCALKAPLTFVRSCCIDILHSVKLPLIVLEPQTFALPLARRLFPSSKREEEKTYLSLSSPSPPTLAPKKDRPMCNRRFPTKKNRGKQTATVKVKRHKIDVISSSLPSSNPTRIRGCGGGGGKRQTHLLQSRDSCAEGAPLYKSVYVYVITTENNCVHTSATLYIYTRLVRLVSGVEKSGGNKSERGVRVLLLRDSPTLSHHPECVKIAASAVVVYLVKKIATIFHPEAKKNFAAFNIIRRSLRLHLGRFTRVPETQGGSRTEEKIPALIVVGVSVGQGERGDGRTDGA